MQTMYHKRINVCGGDCCSFQDPSFFYVSYIYKQKLNLQVGMPESKLLMQLRTEGLRPYLMGEMLAGTKSCRLLEKVL